MGDREGEQEIEIKFKKEPSDLVENQATLVKWAIGSHLETVKAFFEAGSAYAEQQEEITGEFNFLNSIISRRLEDVRSLSITGQDREAQGFIANARKLQGTLVVAAELLTSGTRKITEIDWNTMDYRDTTSRIGKLKALIEGKGLVINGRKIPGREIEKISADPVAQTRFYLTVAAAKRGELAGLKEAELLEGLKTQRSLRELRVTSNESLYKTPPDITWPSTPQIMPEIKITKEDLG